MPLNEKSNMVFMTMVDIQGQLFTDQMGCFPLTSNRGNNYVVIFFIVDANHINSYPIKSCHRTELLQAYNDVYAYLHVQGYQPQLNKLDNESSIPLQKTTEPTPPNEPSEHGNIILLLYALMQPNLTASPTSARIWNRLTSPSA
ncbi:hypothetical protein ACHAW6_010288 [Cyclotella cf. meneghiniana]